jgi:N-dimethylarginine dimethylaminohydrolase
VSRSAFLMCPPDYDEALYGMNPWRHDRRKLHHERANRQWRDLFDLLKKKLDCDIELLTPVKGLAGMVFAASGGLVRKRLFIRGNFRNPKLAGEEICFEKWFKKHGFLVKTIEKPFVFEGEADSLWMAGGLYSGFHFPQDTEGHERVGKILGVNVLGIEIRDKRFCHFDACFAPLDAKTALVFLPALDPYAGLALLENIGDPIRVPEDEALRFACHVVVIGRDVVIPSGCPKTSREIGERGFRVHELDCSEFIKAGGAAKSLVLKLA